MANKKKGKFTYINSKNVNSRHDDSPHLIVCPKCSFERFDVISISSWDQYDRVVVDNYDGSAISTMELIQDNQLEQWSQEIRFISTGSDDFTWVTGFNISNENVEAYDIFDD
jgi:iron complex outermembrane receptor protein